MSYNKVKELNKYTFHGLQGLIRLQMDHNNIEFINPEAFYGLTSLKLVHLEGNAIRQLHPDTFVTLRYIQIFKTSSIKNIYLSDNALSSLPPEIFSYAPDLESIYLHGNPWACHCNMEWFVKWVEEKPGKTENESHFLKHEKNKDDNLIRSFLIGADHLWCTPSSCLSN